LLQVREASGGERMEPYSECLTKTIYQIALLANAVMPELGATHLREFMAILSKTILATYVFEMR
jgi:hypothetical protein